MMDYIYAALTILWFALVFTSKGESVSNYAPAYGRWRDALRDADWWYDRMLNAATILSVADAVRAHVEKCFTAESDVYDEIANGALTTVDGVHARFDEIIILR